MLPGQVELAGVNHQRERIELQSLLRFGQGGLELPGEQQIPQRVPIARHRMIRVQRQRPLEFLRRARPIKLVNRANAAERGVRFGQGFINRQRLLHRGLGLGLGHSLLRRQKALKTEQNMTVGQTGISQRIARLQANRLLAKRDALPQARLGAFVQIKARLQIQIISREIFRIALDELRVLITGQLHFQLVDNRTGNVILNGKHVAQLAIILSRPELKAIFDAGELSGETQLAACFAHAPFQGMADIKLFADRADILLFALECKR